MSSAGSITHWIGALRTGDPDAAQNLWERYCERLVHLARKMLRGTARRAADEEDVALSAFDSFCRGAGRGRFPLLLDRDNLWRLLVVITSRKAFDVARSERCRKRDGRRMEELDLEELLDPEPTPEFAAQFADECRRLLDLLGDAELRTVALWKMEGYDNGEIAQKLGCVRRTVERKLNVIRSIWTEQLAP